MKVLMGINQTVRYIAQITAPAASVVVGEDDVEDDPEEVDISKHRYISAANNSRSLPLRSSSSDHNRDIIASHEAELRRLLRGERPPGCGGGGGGGPNNMENPLYGPLEGGLSVGQEGGEDDLNPMKMLQQLMGGGEKLLAGLPPEMAAMFGGMMPPSASAGGGFAQSGSGELADDKKNDDGYLWKIVHAIFALGLGIYITAMTTFSGAKSSSSSSSSSSSLGATTSTADVHINEVSGEEVRQFFWAFATAELLLQSTRFFLEKGRVSSSGWVAALIGVLPEPWKGYLALGTRYGGIYTTVVQDAMAVLFVLGCAAWWKGAV